MSVDVNRGSGGGGSRTSGVAVQHQLTRSRQVVSLGDDPGVVSTNVRRSGEP